MKKSFKGQAALEFMMTYGWAILVVLAAIGALSYFGVLNPSRFTPDTCLASAPFSCPGKPVASSSGNYVLFSIVNGQGYTVTLSTAPTSLNLSGSLSGCVLGATGANASLCSQGTSSCGPGPDVMVIPSGQGATVVLNCSATVGSSNIIKGDATFNYTNPDSRLQEQLLISVTAKPR